jgi:uncharacterized membrane protein (DUF2068 family)
MKSIESVILDFCESSADVVVALRDANGLNQVAFDRSIALLEELLARCPESIPRKIIPDLLILRDNLIGAVEAYRGDERKVISHANSRLEQCLEGI